MKPRQPAWLRAFNGVLLKDADAPEHVPDRILYIRSRGLHRLARHSGRKPDHVERRLKARGRRRQALYGVGDRAEAQRQISPFLGRHVVHRQELVLAVAAEELDAGADKAARAQQQPCYQGRRPA